MPDNGSPVTHLSTKEQAKTFLLVWRLVKKYKSQIKKDLSNLFSGSSNSESLAVLYAALWHLQALHKNVQLINPLDTVSKAGSHLLGTGTGTEKYTRQTWCLNS